MNEMRSVLKRWEEIFDVFREMQGLFSHLYTYEGSALSRHNNKILLYYSKHNEFADDDEVDVFQESLTVDSWIYNLNDEGLKKYFKLLTEKESMENTLERNLSDIKESKDEIKKLTEEKIALLEPNYIKTKQEECNTVIRWNEESITRLSNQNMKINEVLKESFKSLKEKYTIKRKIK